MNVTFFLDQNFSTLLIDDQSFRFKSELNCAHPVDLDEDVWYEPLVFGINVVGHWDRKRGS